MALFLLVSLFVSLSLGAPTALNQTLCFSPNANLLTDTKISSNSCGRYQSKIIAGNNITIDYVGTANLTETKFECLERVANVSTRTLSAYSELLGSNAGLSVHINVLAGYIQGYNPSEISRHKGDSLLGFSGSICYIDIPDFDGDQAPYFQNLIAHHLYHCVQDHLGLTPSFTQFGSAKWWYESAAEYHASTYYPDPHETAITKFFDTYYPLYEQGAKTQSFLIYLSSIGWTDFEIHSWLSSQALTESMDEEIARISHDVVLRENFPGFAARFADKRITSRSGTTGPWLEAVMNDGGALGHRHGTKRAELSFLTRPFEVRPPQWAFLATDRKITFNFTAENSDVVDGMVLQWKKTGDKAWRRMSSGQILEVPGTTYGLPGDAAICPQRDTKYTFMITKTFDDSKKGDPDRRGSGWIVHYEIAEPVQPLDPACEPPLPAVPPPAPVHASMTRKCNKYTMGDTLKKCEYGSTAEFGISMKEFYAWNPFVEPRCEGLYNYAYCIGVAP